MALEKKLKVPPQERSRCAGELRTAPVVELKAVRVDPLIFDALGRPIGGKENTPELHRYMTVSKKEGKAPEEVRTVTLVLGTSSFLYIAQAGEEEDG